MKKVRHIVTVTSLATAIAIGLIVAPNGPITKHNQVPAEATYQNNCNPSLVRVSLHGSYELYVRLCVNQADDLQSLRTYAGWECRYGGVRHNQCRVQMPHLQLWMDGTIKRDDNMGTYPTAPNFADGWSGYGTWYNPPGLCWGVNTNWNSEQQGWSVRYDDGYLDSGVNWSGSDVGPIGCFG